MIERTRLEPDTLDCIFNLFPSYSEIRIDSSAVDRKHGNWAIAYRPLLPLTVAI